MPLDTRLSERIEELTPTELALAPFNTSCTDVSFLEWAALRFRRLARDYQAELSSTQLPSPSLSPSCTSRGPILFANSSPHAQDGSADRTFAAGSCSFSWANEFARTVGPAQVKLQEDEIIVAHQSQPLFSVLASKFCVFLCTLSCPDLLVCDSLTNPAYSSQADLEGEIQGECQGMTIQLEAYDAIMQEKTRLGPSFTLRLSLGMVPLDALSTLADAVDRWHQRFEFLISRLYVLSYILPKCQMR